MLLPVVRLFVSVDVQVVEFKSDNVIRVCGKDNVLGKGEGFALQTRHTLHLHTACDQPSLMKSPTIDDGLPPGQHRWTTSGRSQSLGRSRRQCHRPCYKHTQQDQLDHI